MAGCPAVSSKHLQVLLINTQKNLNMKKIVLPTLALLLIGASAGHSQILVNIDFNSTNNGGGATFSGVAVPPDPQGSSAVWNSISNNNFFGIENLGATNLLASNGTPTSISINISNQGGGYSGTGNDLLKDYLYINGTSTPQVITFSGLNDGANYDIYLYGMGDNAGQGSTFTIGSLSQQTNPSPRDGTVFVEGNNYVKFSSVTSTGGTLAINWSLGPDTFNGALNGIQVVVPEPSFYAMAAALVAMLFVLIRKKWSQ